MDVLNFEYTEVAPRTLMFQSPPQFDRWGFDDNGNKWEHYFCTMDDFGNAVPCDPFAHQYEGYKPYLAPDYDPNTPVGQPYKYVMYYPMPH